MHTVMRDVNTQRIIWVGFVTLVCKLLKITNLRRIGKKKQCRTHIAVPPSAIAESTAADGGDVCAIDALQKAFRWGYFEDAALHRYDLEAHIPAQAQGREDSTSPTLTTDSPVCGRALSRRTVGNRISPPGS